MQVIIKCFIVNYLTPYPLSNMERGWGRVTRTKVRKIATCNLQPVTCNL